MTFSRRAANEMIRRVERIVRAAIGQSAASVTEALSWAGTFHAIGARLLRVYADQIGLDPAFTIHDREDSGDLLNLLRHQLGFSKTEARFPAKGTCLAIYSRCINAESPIEDVLRTSFPWCTDWVEELKKLRLRRSGTAAVGPRLLRSAALLGADDERFRPRQRDRQPVRSGSRRRVSGYKPPSGARVEPGGRPS